MNELFKNQYSTTSARASWHEYNGGTYFITICTENKTHYFGEIVQQIDNTVYPPVAKPKMILSEIGLLTEKSILSVTEHYPYAEVPIFVVMPNHIHAIIQIDEKNTPVVNQSREGVQNNHGDAESILEKARSRIGWLSVVVRGFKSSVTKMAHQNNIEFVWQKQFYDRIIRTQREYDNIVRYIENNVEKWYYKYRT